MDKTEQLTQFLISILIGFVLGITTTVFAYSMGWIQEINILELFAVTTSYACTYLCVVQSRWNYPLAIVTTIAYAWLFYQWGLYGSAIASVYVPFAVIYGWFRWGPDGRTRRVTRTPIAHYPFYIALGLAGWTATFLIADAVGATLPVMDSAILVLTIMAQFMMDNKKLECWIVWITLNVIAIGLYFQTGLYLAALQYVFFLGNAFVAMWLWKKSMMEVDGEYRQV